MRRPWQPAEYERTCLDCGETWLAPRSAARRRTKPVSGYSVAPRGSPRGLRIGQNSAPELAESEAIRPELAACRRGPRCGAEHYERSPARR